MNAQLIDSLVQIINSLTKEERERLETQLSQSRNEKHRSIKINDEPFVGMWQDRQDLTDSGKWVKQVREREWKTRND